MNLSLYFKLKLNICNIIACAMLLYMHLSLSKNKIFRGKALLTLIKLTLKDLDFANSEELTAEIF